MVEEVHGRADLGRAFDVTLEIGFGQTRPQCASTACVDRQPIPLRPIDRRPVALENPNIDTLSAKTVSETEPACSSANNHHFEIAHRLAHTAYDLPQERSRAWSTQVRRPRPQQERPRPVCGSGAPAVAIRAVRRRSVALATQGNQDRMRPIPHLHVFVDRSGRAIKRDAVDGGAPDGRAARMSPRYNAICCGA
jgi:hypothetical protein